MANITAKANIYIANGHIQYDALEAAQDGIEQLHAA